MITVVNERKVKMNEKNLSPISDSEWEVMRIVWTLGETHTNQILKELQAKKELVRLYYQNTN